MSKPELRSISHTYFRRFETYPSQVSTPTNPETKIIIVIPCYNEPDIVTTLRSLANCQTPYSPIEVLIVVNGSQDDTLEIRQQNSRTLREIEQWVKQEQPIFLDCHTIYVDDLTPKHAGVGLARKIGMDEALRRFTANNYDGLIMNLDADCTVAPCYLRALEKTWLTQTIHTITVYFEHVLPTISDSRLQKGIVYYELFLRYYINGLRYANFPYAFHTVGSCMGCRASTYARSGGMNRRKAGEDFYFLHKAAQLGNVVQLTDTTVFPSARTSDRVPFGTGKAQQEWLFKSKRHRWLYHPQSFEDIQQLIEAVPDWYHTKNCKVPKDDQLSEVMNSYLQKEDFSVVCNKLLTETRSWPMFQKRFLAWWNGFRVLKFVHYARDHCYPPIPAEEAGFRLLKKLRILSAGEAYTAEELLLQFRTLDRRNY